MTKTMITTALVLLISLPGVTHAVNVDTPEITYMDVDQETMQTVRTEFPEATNINANFLNTDYDPYLTVNQDANVSVTFLDEGAGYRNSLGWMTFTESSFAGLSKGDIDIDGSGNISLNELNSIDGVDSGWLFTNSSLTGQGGNLSPGATVDLGNGTLESGTSFSFFLGQNSAIGDSGVTNGVFTGSDPVFYGLDFLNPEADFTSTFDSNLSDSRHVAMLFTDDSREQVIMGFEDLNRENRYANDYFYRSDEDFNDTIFTIQSDPAEAFGDSNIATAPLPPLGSGLLGLAMLVWLSRMSFVQRATTAA